MSFFFGEKGEGLLQVGKESEEEKMDYLEFIARVTSHIPDKCQGSMCIIAFLTDYAVVDEK
jgi:hypothetical protein